MKKLDMYHLFGMDVLFTAYSEVDYAPRNSREHFEYVNRIGYPSLKGDVRITSDGRVVMCHDGGFTYDENAHIVSKYDREKTDFLITENTRDAFLQQVHGNYPGDVSYGAHVIDLEEFVDFCKAQNKVCYLTLRRDHVPEVVAEVIRVLKEKDMMEHSLLNSFNYDTLAEIRKHDSDIPISNVRSKLEILSRETVDEIAALGNSVITMFSFLSHPFTPTDSPKEGWEAFMESKDARAYAAQKSVPIHMAQIKWPNAKPLIDQGVTGFHVWEKLYTPPKLS